MVTQQVLEGKSQENKENKQDLTKTNIKRNFPKKQGKPKKNGNPEMSAYFNASLSNQAVLGSNEFISQNGRAVFFDNDALNLSKENVNVHHELSAESIPHQLKQEGFFISKNEEKQPLTFTTRSEQFGSPGRGFFKNVNPERKHTAKYRGNFGIPYYKNAIFLTMGFIL